MSSLDEVFEQMILFQRALLEFDQEVRASASGLAEKHSDVSGLWQDEAGARYRSAYEPLARSLEEYLNARAPRFERFLEVKVQQLARYLHGG